MFCTVCFTGVVFVAYVLPVFSFLSQNLKVPVPDEISLELGRVLLPWVSISTVSTV